jgi:antitoxin (DNA-binding transcriptional repressor) of toxin-antitoxin stability system
MKTREKTITATEFKAKCLAILDDLDPQGLVVLKHGRPVARLVPFKEGGTSGFIGSMKGKIEVKGDIYTTGVRWNAQS